MSTDSKKHVLFVGALAALALVIGGFIYYQEVILNSGTTTILATRPVDPRDLFRGEYVILRYVIESDEKIRAEAGSMLDGDRLYIKLSQNSQGIAEVSEVLRQVPSGYEGLLIVGEVSGGGVRFPSLEQFYLPEGTGRPIERIGTDLHVEVILHEGEARVTRLLDGELKPIDPKSYLEENQGQRVGR